MMWSDGVQPAVHILALKRSWLRAALLTPGENACAVFRPTSNQENGGVEMTPIKQAWIVLNSECDNACRWCYAKSVLSERERFAIEDVDWLHQFLVSLGCTKVIFLGGEPTLHPDLAKALASAGRHGLRQTIVTNGRRLGGEGFLAGLSAKPGCLDFIVSFEGASSGIHDSITQVPGSFEDSLRGVNACKAAGIPVTANLTLGRDNFRQIPAFIGLAHQLELETISFNVAIPPFNYPVEVSDFMAPRELTAITEMLCGLLVDGAPKCFLSTPLPICVLHRDFLNLVKKGVVALTACHVLSGVGLVVNWNCEVLLCTHLPQVPICNLRSFSCPETFADFWSGVVEESVRAPLRQYPSARCESCNSREMWTGGCPLLPHFYGSENILKYES